jgi:hypothetical protein
MVQSIGSTVQWPLPLYNTPDISVNDDRFQKIISRRTTEDIQIFPGFANNGDYFLVETDFGTTDNYVKYYNSAMSLQWTKNETDFQGPYNGMSAISGITLQGSELFVLVSDAVNNTTGDAYNLAKVVADGTVTSIGGGNVTNLELGYMGAVGHIAKPLGKSNFYAIGYQSAVEINSSNGSVVESFANNTLAQTEGTTFLTSDNRSFSLFTKQDNSEQPELRFNNFNSTFGLDGTTVVGVTSSNQIFQKHKELGSVPWHMTPFSCAKDDRAVLTFIDWGDYYILVQHETSTSSPDRYTRRGFWLKTRLDSWMKQFCDLMQIPVNNTFAS